MAASMLRRFIQVSTAWYADTALTAEFERFDVQVEGDDFCSEFSISWPKSSATGSAEMLALDDSWLALSHCNDLVARIAVSPERLNAQTLREHLLSCGFVDVSEIDPPARAAD